MYKNNKLLRHKSKINGFYSANIFQNSIAENKGGKCIVSTLMDLEAVLILMRSKKNQRAARTAHIFSAIPEIVYVL